MIKYMIKSIQQIRPSSIVPRQPHLTPEAEVQLLDAGLWRFAIIAGFIFRVQSSHGLGKK